MLQIIETKKSKKPIVPISEMEGHHYYLINSYLNSHQVRNHSERTIAHERSFLNNWFKNDSLFTWDVMNLQKGRKTILDYTNELIKIKISSKTIRSQLGILSRYFTYVLEHPFVCINENFIKLQHLYGPIEQPISEYDIPKHSYDGEQLGVPIDPELIYDFFHCLRENYLLQDNSMMAVTRARNYTMAVVAAESGLRADEVLHLEISDLFFKSNKIQTRYAKGTRGSGKRARTTIFTPLTKDSINYYLKFYRPLITSVSNNFLFPNKQGRLLNYSNIQKALREMISITQKNNIPILDHMGWHWFRRIFATRFIEKFPHQLSVLVSLLGHTSPNTVHRYIKHSEAWMDNKIKAILEDTSWQ